MFAETLVSVFNIKLGAKLTFSRDLAVIYWEQWKALFEMCLVATELRSAASM